MIDPVEVRILDGNCAALGIDIAGLMDSAGRALADEIQKAFPEGSSILFVCGTGNNGGDGFVAAKYLIDEGYDARVVIYKDPATELARFALMWSKIKPMKASEVADDLFSSADLLVDGLLGAGSEGPPRGEVADLIRRMNSSGVPIYSIDIPSGIGNEPCINARVTVTFHDVKSNMYVNGGPRPECGGIVVRDIGIPEDAARIVGPGDLRRYPVQKDTSRKGDMGKVLVIGGGPYTGAPALASMASVRAGADLVRVLVPAGIRNVIASFSPDLIVEGTGDPSSIRLGPGDLDRIAALIEWSDVVLIGPGAGREVGTIEVLVRAMVHTLKVGKRLVVDADGLFALSATKERVPDGDILITPHKGEMERLLISAGVSEVPEMFVNGSIRNDYIDLVSKYAKDSNFTVLVKGPHDLISGVGDHGLGDHIRRELPGGKTLLRTNRSGHPSMSKGGTGDVLAGLCAGLMARGMRTFDAAGLAAYINGKAGEIAFERRGYSLSASDLLDIISVQI